MRLGSSKLASWRFRRAPSAILSTPVYDEGGNQHAIRVAIRVAITSRGHTGVAVARRDDPVSHALCWAEEEGAVFGARVE